VEIQASVKSSLFELAEIAPAHFRLIRKIVPRKPSRVAPGAADFWRTHLAGPCEKRTPRSEPREKRTPLLNISHLDILNKRANAGETRCNRLSRARFPRAHFGCVPISFHIHGGMSVPGHILHAECCCGFRRELAPGCNERRHIGYTIAYNANESDLVTEDDAVIKLAGLRTVREPLSLRLWAGR